MRKVFICLTLLLGAITTQAQDLPVDSESGKVTFSEVIDAQGLKQDAIYSKVKSWIASNFKSAKAVIDLDDKEGGKIVAKGNVSAGVIKDGINKFDAGRIDLTLTFLLKDDKFKVVATNFVHERAPDAHKNIISCGDIENEKCGNGMTAIPNKKQWGKIKEDLGVTVTGLFTSIKSSMTKNEKDF